MGKVKVDFNLIQSSLVPFCMGPNLFLNYLRILKTNICTLFTQKYRYLHPTYYIFLMSLCLFLNLINKIIT